jgi:hypothetical protein
MLFYFDVPNTTVVVRPEEGAGRARPIFVSRYPFCAIGAVGQTPLAREETVLASAATHNRCASERSAPPAPAAARTCTDALVALLAATMVPGAAIPPPFHPAQTHLRAERPLHAAAAALSRARAAATAERPLCAARPLRAEAAALPHTRAAASATSVPWLDASAATTTSPVVPRHAARPAPPTPRTGAVFPRTFIGLARPAGLERRQTVHIAPIHGPLFCGHVGTCFRP